jgi:hypothetical protein
MIEAVRGDRYRRAGLITRRCLCVAKIPQALQIKINRNTPPQCIQVTAVLCVTVLQPNDSVVTAGVSFGICALLLHFSKILHTTIIVGTAEFHSVEHACTC